MAGETRNIIGDTGSEWRRIGNDGRRICFQGTIETYS